MNNSNPFQDLFPALLENSAEEVSALLGETIELQDEKSSSGSLKEIFSAPKKKFGLIGFDVKNGQTDSAHLCFDMDLAIELGGRLIMLPADEIAACKKQGKIEGELLDAFSEIANIISGVLTTACQESFPERKLHFVKGKLEQFRSGEKELPLPETGLTSFSGSLALESKKLGSIQFLLPHGLLVEDAAAGKEAETVNAGESVQAPDSEDKAEEPKDRPADTHVETGKASSPSETVPDANSEGEGAGSQKKDPGQKNDASEQSPKRIISLIGEDPSQFEMVEEGIDKEGIQLNRLFLDSDLKQAFSSERPSCVFLLLDKVNEQGLARTIKVRAALKENCPLIVAGPGWTRTTVLKARKYGATDILITPAQRDAIRKKYLKYL